MRDYLKRVVVPAFAGLWLGHAVETYLAQDPATAVIYLILALGNIYVFTRKDAP